MALEADMRSPDAASGPPSLEARRYQLRRRVLTSPRCWRLLVLGHSGGGGGDRFAALGRALENLGHAVLAVNWPGLTPGRAEAGGAAGPGAAFPTLSGVQPYLRHFEPGIILCTGGLHFSPEEAGLLKAEGYVLLGLDLDQGDLDPGGDAAGWVEAISPFDLYGLGSPRAFAKSLQAGLTNTVPFPPAADLSQACACLPPAPELAADLLALADADGWPERVTVMAGAARATPRVRLHGKGWPLPGGQDAVIRGVRRMQALREARILVLFSSFGADPTGDGVLFEAVAHGALVAMPLHAGAGTPFKPDTEVIGYRDPDDLAVQAGALLGDPGRLEAMRRAAFARLADEHLYEHRWLGFFRELESRVFNEPSSLPLNRALACRARLANAGTRKRRVLISGFYGGGNGGDELILRAIRQAIAKPADPYELVVAAYDAKAVIAVHGMSAFPRTDLPRAQGEAMAATAVIQGGGGLWHDYTFAPAGSLLGMFSETQSAVTGYSKLPLLARVFDRPFHVYGLGVGPLTDPDARAYTRFLARQAQSICVRDEASRALLTAIPGWDAPVEVFPDPVFALDLGEPDQPPPVSLGGEGSVIGLNLRPWQRGDGGAFLARLASALNDLAEDRPIQLLGIPLQQPEDTQVIEELFRRLDARIGRRRLAMPPLSDPLAAVGAIRGCDAFIGMRYHACLLAHRLGVPALGLVYDPKVHALFQQVGCLEAALPLDVDPGYLRLRIQALLEEGEDYRQRAGPRVRELEGQARAGLERLRARLDTAPAVTAPLLAMASPSPTWKMEEVTRQLEIAKTAKEDVTRKLEIAKTEQERLASLLRALTASVEEIMNSKSWRVTAPLRAGMERAARVRWHLRRHLESLRSVLKSRSAPAMPAPSPSTREGFESLVTLEASSAFVAAEPPRHLTDLRLAAILDTFSLSCFEPECQVITFRPDNWRQVLTASPPHLLFVESAWNGNDGAWQYRIACYPTPPGRELPELVAWCKAQGIPTVFWNKEDPPHFDDFIDTARLFDVVLTTDAHCIPRYQELCGHDRVHVLPFAAQPRLHHPVQTEERNHKLCFAGTYYGNRFDARREGMTALLTPALEFDLDIYDRMHGAVGPGTEAYRFPEEYVPHIRGRLPYPEMVAAYRRYRAFLNVNSVTDSPTMFARRVFELLACGTPVVSTESAGIRALFPAIVPVVTTPAEARAAFAELLTDDALWRRRSAMGIRRVMERHGYRHRLERVCGLLGFGLEADMGLEVVLAVLPGPCPEITARHILGQSQPPTSILLLANGQAEALRKALADPRGQADIRVVEQFSVALADKGDAILAFFDGRHSYGPHYLADARLALDYSGAAMTGLRAHFALAEGEVRLDETLGQAHFMAMEVMGAGLVCRAGALAPSVLDRVFAAPTLTLDQACYARGPFEFLAGAALDWGDERLEPVILEEPGDAGQA